MRVDRLAFALALALIILILASTGCAGAISGERGEVEETSETGGADDAGDSSGDLGDDRDDSPAPALDPCTVTLESEGRYEIDFEYDERGKLVRQTIRGESSESTYLYEWDPSGLFSTETTPWGTVRERSYEDLPTGQRIRTISGETFKIEFSYDATGNLLEALSLAEDGEEIRRRTYESDAGRILAFTSATGGSVWRQEYSYDPSGRLERVDHYSGEGDSPVYVVHFVRDISGLITHIEDDQDADGTTDWVESLGYEGDSCPVVVDSWWLDGRPGAAI